jgi:hypothetical protein
MATTYTSSNRLADLTPFDPTIQNNWGTPNSENMVLVDSALDGLSQVSIAGLSTYSLTTNSGAPDQARERMQSFTGALTGACTVTLPNVQKWGYAQNATTGGQNVVLSAGGSTTLTIPPDGLWYLYWTDGNANASGLSLGMTSGNATGNFAVGGNLSVGGTTVLTGALTAPTISGPVAFGSTIGLPNNTALTMADTLNVQRNILNLNSSNFVTLFDAGNVGWHFVDGPGTNTVIGIGPSGNITVNGLPSGKDCVVTVQANTNGGAAVAVNSLASPAHNFTSYISALTTLGSFHAIFTFQGVICGSITTGAGNTTNYNTTSDATMKIDDGPLDDVGRIIDKLKPRWFRWKNTPGEEAQPGFFAQQVYRAFPWAVTKGRGRGDSRKPWQMDNSKLVPLLVAELQALRKRVRELERCHSDR